MANALRNRRQVAGLKETALMFRHRKPENLPCMPVPVGELGLI